MELVAVTSLVDDAEGAAAIIGQDHEHGTGTLVDDQRKLKITGATASVTDCLDEMHWYVVSDRTGQPDPGVARGYFDGSGTLVDHNSRWYVSTWKSEGTSCTF